MFYFLNEDFLPLRRLEEGKGGNQHPVILPPSLTQLLIHKCDKKVLSDILIYLDAEFHFPQSFISALQQKFFYRCC
jgi:hypothetical protein